MGRGKENSAMEAKKGPLEGIKVVELGSWIAVPGCGAVLGDWGAEVIKIENINCKDSFRSLRYIRNVDFKETNTWYIMLNRNKKSIALDIKLNQGKRIFFRLLKNSDVFITNFTQNKLESMSLDYLSIKNLNPKLVYTHFTAYGSQGPDKEKPGYDIMAFWSRGGFMNKLTSPGNAPPSQPQALGDSTGAALLAGAVSTALFSRERTGKGQKVEMSLYQNATWCLGGEIMAVLTADQEVEPVRQNSVENPLWNVYQTKDGGWLHLACLYSDNFWYPLCEAIGREDLKADPRFKSVEMRSKNNSALIAILNDAFSKKNISEWCSILERYNIMFEIVRSVTDVVRDPQSEANDFFGEVIDKYGQKIKVVNSPFKFSETPASIRTSYPECGEHSEDILLELGFSAEEISKFKGDKVII